jgi:uncharacterized membrane protein YqjE
LATDRTTSGAVSARQAGQTDATGGGSSSGTGGDGTTGAVSATQQARRIDAPGDGSGIGPAVQEITQKAQLLVREEIELARVELTQKATSLAKGAAVGAAAGIFAAVGLLFLLHGLAWLIAEILGTDAWVGFFIVAGLLLVLAAVAGLLAARFLKKGTPPKPELAIDEAQRIRQTIDEARH